MLFDVDAVAADSDNVAAADSDSDDVAAADDVAQFGQHHWDEHVTMSAVMSTAQKLT